MAHHDTVNGSPGADDNGSGVVALLELARLLARRRFRHTVVLAVEPERVTMIDRLLSGRSDFLGDDYEMPEADRIEMAKHQRAAAAHLLTGLAPGVDGWVDDDLAFVKPWGVDVASCRVPVVPSYGRQDQLVPAAHGDWLAARVPDAVSCVDDGTGHMGNDAEMERDLTWLAGGARAQR